MLDETTGVKCKSQIFTVLRYVSDTKVCERFSRCSDGSSDRTSYGLFKHVQAISQLGCDKTLGGQTYDGTPVMEGNVTGLQTNLLTSYPKALFTLCYAHSMHLVLQQLLAIIKESKTFFKTLSDFSTFS
ncbi:hypothetical protein Cfor_05133 [Coptotermes formosanus]|uniref:DUF4371 domain-containing protein n=1 Tax=Coptotermes formosanus TaxID=36987 RepID=A0A6L2PMH3_COPFO|nr:hypothetical protein Cfor_05133 [Coptotermes formosanus]